MMSKLKLFFFVIFIVFIYIKLSFYNKNLPRNITNTSVCVNDGMLLLDYNGPKAQIVWNDNTCSFFCEPREAFYEYFNPINRKRISNFFVQDFSCIPWGSYTDKWFNVEEAFFVINSDKNGAMGVSYVPFSNEFSATAFKKIYGGKLISFSKITPQILLKSNELLRKRLLEDL